MNMTLLLLLCISTVPFLHSGNTSTKELPDLELQSRPVVYSEGPWIEYMLEDVPSCANTVEQERKFFGEFHPLKTLLPCTKNPPWYITISQGADEVTQLYPERVEADATFYKATLLLSISNTVLAKMIYSCHKTCHRRVGVLWATTCNKETINADVLLLKAIEQDLRDKGCKEVRAYCKSPEIDEFYEKQSYELRNKTLLFTKNLEHSIKKKEQ